jgi:hypothetical protein
VSRGLVANVAAEVEVDAGQFVFEQKEAELAEVKALVTAPHDLQAQARLEQHARRVDRQAGGAGHLVDAEPAGRSFRERRQHAAIAHHRRRLEGQGRERQMLRRAHGFERGQRILVEHRGPSVGCG